MANVLRYQQTGTRFVRGLEPLPEDDLSAEKFGMPAPQNLSGVLERNVAPGEPNPTARGEFQLREPGQLQLPQRDDTPHLGSLTLPNAASPSIAGSQQRRLSMVEGLPDVGAPPEPPAMKSAGPIPTGPTRTPDEARALRRLAIGQMVAGVLGVGARDEVRGAFDQARGRVEGMADDRYERLLQQQRSAAEQEQQAYEREMQGQRLALEDRRIAQAEGATSQDQDRAAAMYDPTHPAAQSARIAYARLYRAIPPSALPQLSAFQPDRAMQGMSAMDIRQQANALTQAWGRLQAANPNLFRVGRRSTGGRGARNGLAGLSGGGRTVDYGVSEGLTPEDWQALGINPSQFGGGEEAPEEGAMAAPMVAQPPPPAPSQTRPQPAGGQPMGGGMRAQDLAAPGAPAQPAAAPQGRPLIDRPMTSEELAQASPQLRRTQLLAEAQLRKWVAGPSRWRDAVATVEGYQPAERDRLMAEYGSQTTTLVPGWRRVQDTGRFSPDRIGDLRSAVTQYNQVRADARRIQQIVREVQALDLADDAVRGHPLVSEWRSLSRRIQTALRMIDRTGVPTGNEQVRAMEEAPEPDGIQALMRASQVYSTLPDALGRNIGIYMRDNGFAPESRPGGR